jgi:hypothetical protein
MFIAQVPSVLIYHEEYFVTYEQVPLQTNLSRYPIPTRATGMKLRDLFWMDQNGNLFEMTRVEEHDRAFFQKNVGANQAVHKFFIQGNDVILTPGVVDSPTGSLIFVFYLRPNQLVKNDRAAIVQNFVQTININNTLINPLDQVNIGVIENVYNQIGNNLIIQTSLVALPIGNPGPTPFTAVNIAGGTITAVQQYSGSNMVTQITTLAPHQLSTNQTVIIAGTDSNPIADGTYLVQVVDDFNFIIPLSITTPEIQTVLNISNISVANPTIVTSSTPHGLTSGETIAIYGSNSTPSVDGSYVVTVIDPTHFSIPVNVTVGGTLGSFVPQNGTFTSPNQFLIGSSNTITAQNLSTSINNVVGVNNSLSITNPNINTIINATFAGGLVTVNFNNIATQLTTTNITGFVIPQATIGINFQTLPSTYTDQETNLTDNLFIPGALVDMLQTNPGHRTYVYDVQIPLNGISGTTVTFPVSDLLVPTETVNNGAGPPGTPISSTVQFILASIVPGDYMCVANEAIIPQIPPDLHNALAERTSARILAAIGDQPGLQASMAKIQEIEGRQGNLLDNRAEGNPQKVVNRHSMLRYGKMGTLRRV